MKLINIILEDNYSTKKAVIMAGASGSGKSSLLNKLGLKSLPVMNPDKYVEDPNSDMYNNLSAASRQVEQDVAKAIQAGQPFIWDTTAGNYDKVASLKQKGYDIFMVMVYTHPVISLMSNMRRPERRVPTGAVFATWRNVYQLAPKYKSLLGNNFVLFNNDRSEEYRDEIEKFNQAIRKGDEGIKGYMTDLRSRMGNDSFKSTFSKPFELPSQAQAQWNKEMASVSYDKRDESLEKALKKYWIGWFEKNGTGPGADKMKKKIDSIYRTKESEAQKQKEVYQSIADMLSSQKFIQNIQHSSFEEIKSKLQRFL